MTVAQLFRFGAIVASFSLVAGIATGYFGG